MGLPRFTPAARSPDRPASLPASPRDDGAYLTDGQRLFRVVWPLCSLERGELAILEDCKTLCLTAFTANELRGMQLTSVTPTTS
jgi:hypothetical protein